MAISKSELLQKQEQDFICKFPEVSSLEQDEEWCTVTYQGEERKIRFHDYDEVYTIPGLYEHLFYERLKCESPKLISSLLDRTFRENKVDPSNIKVLDMGAGNGMMGEELHKIGVDKLIGLDIITEAKMALLRDRPGLYSGYLVEDLTDLTPEGRKDLEEANCNCLTTVATLGFGDIPVMAFTEAFNLIDTPGWIAFNIRDTFLSEEDHTGFSRLIREMMKHHIIDQHYSQVYRHRLAIDGTPLNYFAIVAEKKKDIPQDWYDWMQELM